MLDFATAIIVLLAAGSTAWQLRQKLQKKAVKGHCGSASGCSSCQLCYGASQRK